jgi:prepilin-type N-terminal cleavage/methylation domain-containing protein
MTRIRSRSKTSTDGGFTLIEVLVVVIMVAILMGIAAPGWLSYLNRQRMRAVENDLSEVFRQAQTNAKQLRIEQLIEVDTAADLPTVRVNGSPQVLGSSNLPPGSIRLAVSPAPSTAITFDYTGSPPVASVPFVVTITPDGATAQRCVIVANLLGAIKTARDAECNVSNATFGTDN